jgi:electron transport complex protein RnfD
MRKAMLVPSKKFKLVKKEKLHEIEKVLFVLAGIMMFMNYYMYSFMHMVKFASIVAISIIAVREFEILFYSHNKDLNREDAKELITGSYPTLLALVYALMIPVGTPLWIVAFGAVLATFLGKLIIGGFTHSVFNPSLIGVLYITFGYSVLAHHYEFGSSLTNFIFKLLFDNPLFNEGLSFSGMNVFNGSNVLAVNGFETYSLVEVIFGAAPGIVGGGVFVLAALAYLVYKKAVNYLVPVLSIVSLIVMYLIVGQSFEYALYQLFTGSFLFVIVFAGTDVITAPVTTYGKIIFAIIIGVLTVLIREAGTYAEGVVFALLFANMLTPMFNFWFDKKKKPVKKAGAK